MGIKERLFEHPTAFFSGCFVWIFLAIWIYALVVWMIQGDVDFPVGLIGCVIAIALGYITMNPPNVDWAPWIGIASASPVVLFPFVSAGMRKRQLTQIDVEEVERAYEALGFRPNNAALKFRLAKTLYNRGLVHAAIALGEPSLREMPKQHYGEEHRMVVGWKHYAQGEPPHGYTCMTCGFFNKPGQAFCQGCGGRLFLEPAAGRWVGKSTMQKVLVVWFGLVLLAVGIPAAALSLPPIVALCACALMFALAGYGCFVAFRQAEQHA